VITCRPLQRPADEPVRTTITASQPGFFNFKTFPANEGGMSMLRSYAQGDDYVLGQANAPGQASAVNVRATESADASTRPTRPAWRPRHNRDGRRSPATTCRRHARHRALQGKPQTSSRLI